MDRVFEAGAVLVAPSAPASPSTGFPTGGNPVGGVPATKPGAWWFHMITEELRAIVTAAGLAPDHAVLNQVLQGLPAALASRPEMARSLGLSGYQKLPGGLILQWGVVTSNAMGDVAITFPIAFPTAALRMFLGTVSSGDGRFSRASGSMLTTGTSIRQQTNLSSQACDWLVIGN